MWIHNKLNESGKEVQHFQSEVSVLLKDSKDNKEGYWLPSSQTFNLLIMGCPQYAHFYLFIAPYKVISHFSAENPVPNIGMQWEKGRLLYLRMVGSVGVKDELACSADFSEFI